MAAAIFEVPFVQVKTDPPREEEELNQLVNWYSRCYKTLRFLAGLILDDSRMAEEAVQNCWMRASRNPLSFESEGSFGSWIMRLLVSEALSIRQQRHAEAFDGNDREFRNK
jgi:DNA-directed RNA polymerase specialized sigma24 family protein